MDTVSFQYWSLIKFWAQGLTAGEDSILSMKEVLDMILREPFLAVACAACCVCMGVKGEGRP